MVLVALRTRPGLFAVRLLAETRVFYCVFRGAGGFETRPYDGRWGGSAVPGFGGGDPSDAPDNDLPVLDDG